MGLKSLRCKRDSKERSICIAERRWALPGWETGEGLSRTVVLSGSGAEVAYGAGKDAGGGWGPSQMSWSPELLIWLSLPPEHSGLSVLFSYLLDWSCPCTRTCSADLQDIYSISVMQGLWNVWIHHPDLLLTGSVVGQLLLLEPRVLIYGRQVMVPLVPSQQMLLGRERRDPVTCLAVCLAQHP